MSKLTPYDTGKRLEPRPWLAQHRETADDWGKVDFDNEESATEAIVYIEKAEPGYALHVYNTGTQPLKLVLEEEDKPVPVIQPTEKLRENVQNMIANLSTETERIGAEVYWSDNDRRAMVLVPGETGYRKQLLIFVTDVGDGEPSSAYVKGWADGIRETRIG